MRPLWPSSPLIKVLILLIALQFIYFISRSNSIFASRSHAISEASTSNNLITDTNGFLQLPEAEAYCRQHNWKVYPKRTDRRTIYDMFLINGELDWLEIRLNELKDHVDYFVILESETTFTNRPKPLHLKLNWEALAEFHDKIIYRVLDKSGFVSFVTWDHEHLQRNALFDQVFPELESEQHASRAKPGDVMIVSDIDEIPRPETLALLRNCDFPRRLTLRSRFYYYSFQFLHQGQEWAHPQATFYEGDKTIRPANLRTGDGSNAIQMQLDKADLWNAAWHCSSCFGTLAEMLNKMSSFSHTKWNRPEFRDEDGIVRRVREGLDLFDRKGETYKRVEENKDIPNYLLRNRENFPYILNRDGPNAGFSDYNLTVEDIS